MKNVFFFVTLGLLATAGVYANDAEEVVTTEVVKEEVAEVVADTVVSDAQ